MSFQLILSNHQSLLDRAVTDFKIRDDLHIFVSELSGLVDQIRQDIPVKKRISFGLYSVLKELGSRLYDVFLIKELPVFNISAQIFDDLNIGYSVRGLALQMISIHGLENLDEAWPYIQKGALSDMWIIREFTVGFVRKLIERYPGEMKEKYLKILETDDKNLRRFVSESLRPVRENRWFQKKPEWQLDILGKMFSEKGAYARTSVGNNLSDWARTYPEVVYDIVKKLVATGDKNSFQIAYRACRNLVKKDPKRVMDMLGVNEYKYKDRVYYRKDL